MCSTAALDCDELSRPFESITASSSTFIAYRTNDYPRPCGLHLYCKTRFLSNRRLSKAERKISTNA